MASTPDRPEPENVLFRVQRGLAGYVSYLAACEMNASFSEYVLYEPILRILTARKYSVQCEVECPGITQPKTGDRKRLDFVACGHGLRFALEVKWAESRSRRTTGNVRRWILDVRKDYAKLAAFQKVGKQAGDRALLCVFGRQSDIESLVLKPASFSEPLPMVVAGLKKTKFGCRIYELASPNKA